MIMNSVIKYSEEKPQQPDPAYDFVHQTTGELLEVLGDYQGSSMNINAYTPNYVLGKPSGGFIRVLFEKENVEPQRKRIGFAFGETDGDGDTYRLGFDREAWHQYPDDWRSAGITAQTFDEAWRIICLLGSKLNVERISISYGSV